MIKKLLNNYLLATAIALLVSQSVFADYFVELDLSVEDSDADMRTKTDIYALDAEFYIGSVADEDVPLGEAAFLSKASSVRLNYFDAETEAPFDSGLSSVLGLSSAEASIVSMEADAILTSLGISPAVLDAAELNGESDGWAIGGSYVLADKFIFDLTYSSAEWDYSFKALGTSASLVNGLEVETLKVGVGIYVNSTTALGVSYAQADTDSIIVDTDTALFNDTYDRYAFFVRSVVETYSGKNVGGELTVTSGETPSASTVTDINGRMDYYFTNRFSMGATMNLQLRNRGSDKTLFGIQSQYFINKNMAFRASFSTTVFEDLEPESLGDDPISPDRTDTYRLALVGRI